MTNQADLSCFIVCSFMAFTSAAKNNPLADKLDHAKWQTNKSINYQVNPQTFEPANGNFSYRILTTETGILLRLTATIVDDLRMRTQENDTEFSNDHFQIILDMSNKGQDAYVFAINHQGQYLDGQLNIDNDLDLDWSAQWDYTTEVENDKWQADVFIPWQAMAFSTKQQNEFGLYISRFDESNNATYATAPVNTSMNSFYQQFQKYEVKITTKPSFDIFPYLSWDRDILNNKNESSFGADIFWQLSQGQQLSATLNPDFGQVESNELVVNFSAIETFFSEKRSFFNDNQSVFAVEGPETLRILHSPRIGGDAYYDEDYRAEINSAFKYTVNQANYDIGFLSAFENSSQQDKGRDLYAIRGKYALGSSNIGVSVNQVKTPSIARKSTVMATDVHYAVTEDSAINLGIVSTKAKVEQLLTTDIGWWLTGSADITEQHSHEFSLFSYGKDLQLNDIGYVKRVNRKQFEYEYQYQIPNFSALISDITFKLETEIKTNFQNEKLPRIFGAGVELVTENEFEYQVSVELISSGFDDLTTRGNNSMLLPSAQIIEFELSSAEYDWGKYELEVELGQEGWQGDFYNLTASFQQQFNQNILLGFSLSQYNSSSWLDWDEDNTVEAYNFTEQGIALSLNYQIDDIQELRVKFETVIGKGQARGNYHILTGGSAQIFEQGEDFSFAENAFQLRYKYALSKLTAFYVSYSFAGEYEDEYAEFNKRNLYKKAIDTKNSHNLFAKLRLHF